VFSTNNAAITKPTLVIAFYGYESKDFLIGGNSKTIGTARTGFTEVPRTDGKFQVQYDMASYTSTNTPTIPAMIADGTIKRAEVAVRPVLANADGKTVSLDATSVTFDLVANAVVDDDYFKGDNQLVSETKCNACHDALATTFHSGDRGGNITECRMCHVPVSAGSHLEMASRSLDSYAHAIHSFQAFDSGDIFTATPDPVEVARYNLHIEHVFPNFTILNCESCHEAGTYNMPDQQFSMGGLLSKADTWGVDRNIGAVPQYVTGPASRACGGCHRAELINEDAAGELASFNQHTAMGGYLVDPGTDTSLVYKAIDKIMTLFE
jgi:OmcA/MtrC family decaheme c-type cytochrome